MCFGVCEKKFLRAKVCQEEFLGVAPPGAGLRPTIWLFGILPDKLLLLGIHPQLLGIATLMTTGLI